MIEYGLNFVVIRANIMVGERRYIANRHGNSDISGLSYGKSACCNDGDITFCNVQKPFKK